MTLDVDCWDTLDLDLAGPLDVDAPGSSGSESARDLLELAVETSRPEVLLLLWDLEHPDEDADADDSLPSPSCAALDLRRI